MQNELSKEYPAKVLPQRPAQTRRGFNGLGHLSDSQIIPLQIHIALYQTRWNGVIGEEYQINNPTKL